jgi:phosphopantothenoylcysteine decarboxylase/phosphopantothenate--cysteine ligase
LKKIILGVSGSIAAYKSLVLTRLLVKSGLDVKVIMTPASLDFVTALSFETLSKNEVISEISSESSWNNHVELGLWADAFVIAPATANTLSKMATGQADNMLLATYLSARCPVFVAPAMDLDMWKHPATIRNVASLVEDGVHLIPVEHGELASGLVGEGRMAEPEQIKSYLDSWTARSLDLDGKHVLITAGPTHEAIDPVRFIGNHSTGKMGISLAEECAKRGAHVDLILGPTHRRPAPSESLQTIHVTSADEMYTEAKARFSKVDIAIFAAAVADYRPKETASEKIKKQEKEMSITLTKNNDIAAQFGKVKRNDQFSLGFALETENELQNAKLKLDSKNFDAIVLNSLNDEGAGFHHSTNKVSIIAKNNMQVDYELKSKADVAADIIDSLVLQIQSSKHD